MAAAPQNPGSQCSCLLLQISHAALKAFPQQRPHHVPRPSRQPARQQNLNSNSNPTGRPIHLVPTFAKKRGTSGTPKGLRALTDTFLTFDLVRRRLHAFCAAQLEDNWDNYTTE